MIKKTHEKIRRACGQCGLRNFPSSVTADSCESTIGQLLALKRSDFGRWLYAVRIERRR